MDYTNAKHYKNQKEAEAALSEGLDVANPSTWWAKTLDKDDDSRLSSFINFSQMLKTQNLDREQANIRHARLYENVEINSLTTPDYAMNIVRQSILGTGVVSLNVVQAAIDTLAAKISKNKPRPDFQTFGGTWKSQMKARKLNRWVQGFIYEVQAYENMKPVFIDAEVFGTGFLHLFKNEDDDRLDVERVMPSELFFDEADSLTGKPRQMFRRKVVQREVLAATFPDKAKEIRVAPKAVSRDTSGTGQTSENMLEVWEGWHLPSSKKAKDGRHVIAINGCMLECEDWNIPFFPFVVIKSKPRVVGVHGKGTAESLVGIQLELNRLMKSISEQLRRKGRGRIFVERGSKVVPAHLTNGVADIVYYTGTMPQVDNSNVVSQDEFAQVDRLYARAFQEVGVSELSAASKKPSGLDAGVALREFSDIESERFALKHQSWDNAFCDLVKVAIALIKTQYPKLANGYKVRLPSRRRAIEIDFKEIDLDEESYVMQMFPTSSLPQTPGARKQFVKELEADGMISKAVAKRLLGFPDVEAEMDLGNAALDDVDATISAILDEPKPKLMPPEPYQNLELLLERTMANYLFARHFEDIEPERLEMLRTLADMTSKMLEPPAPPPGAMPAGPPGMPAMPPAPPVQMPNINVSGPQVNMPAAPAVPPLVA